MRKILFASILAATTLLASCENPVRLDEKTEIPTQTSTQSGKTIVQSGDTISVIYTGSKLDGSIFDASSKHNNEPLTFVVGAGQMIRGFDEGVVGMKLKETKKITIAPEKAYGKKTETSTVPKKLFDAFIEQTVSRSEFADTLTRTVPKSSLPENTKVGSELPLSANLSAKVVAMTETGATISIPNKQNPFAGKTLKKGLSATLPNGAKIEITKLTNTEVSLRIENKENPLAGKKLTVGMTAQLPNVSGSITVKAITETGVVIEVPGQHPLAGETLIFDVQVLDIK